MTPTASKKRRSNAISEEFDRSIRSTLANAMDEVATMREVEVIQSESQTQMLQLINQ